MRLLRWLGIALVALVLVALAALGWMLNDRTDLSDWESRAAPAAPEGFDGVRLQFLGVTTLLFDDGETQLLVDGFFSRPGLLDLAVDRPVAPDAARIDAGLSRAGIERLAALLTVHSHYDHAMDVAEVAQRTGAVVVGSRSTANAARGGGVPESQITEVAPGEALRFGRFRVTFLESLHAPLVDGGPPMPGEIAEPLVPPAPISAYREGGSFSILIAHPRGRALVQGSAGYVASALAGRAADVVLLGVGGLSRLGPEHREAYWDEIVSPVRPRRLLPIHWDDLTRDPDAGQFPATPPRLLDDLEATLRWLRERSERDGIALELPRAYQPIALY
jgi:L-ascorbate metabolism protein UlaG (beta-lactamase superfamily)